MVFSLTKGFHHSSIATGNQLFIQLGKEFDFVVDTTTNPRQFQEQFLKNYAAIVFLNTTGNVLNRSQEAALERYIQAGGSFVGIHAASDTEYDWPWYGKLVGAYFQKHPPIQKAKIKQIAGQENGLLEKIPNSFELEDEWYNFRPGSLHPENQNLMELDENSYEGGTMQNKHPIAWYKNFDGGKSFYSGIGHREETYGHPVFKQLIWNGLKWALDHPALDYSKARTAEVPDEDRFSQTILASHLDEPMELAVEPNGNIWVVGRKGQIWHWDEEDQKFDLRHQMDVWTKYEDGLLGITLDHQFSENQWVYLFYSPNKEESVQHVSRFTIKNDSIDFASEKILLKIPVQRLECCHSGGSLVMDKHGILWISVGDNTNPHKADGYGALDSREGRDPFDAQKSSGNTNDLRGKILRIKPEADGTYSIPAGNLFLKGTPKTRPEIYTMGCRNPFRISINEEGTGLAWGDVGPDGGKDSIYGPMGYDEINLTYQAGFFGWPYFIANNLAYTRRNFADSVPAGEKFNPKVPVQNLSPRNTGQKTLPLPQPAWIYYPYRHSDSFPELGNGGRCAMAGPWIPRHRRGMQLPSYYFGKLLVYEWMRGWVFAVDPNPAKKPKMERILSKFSFSKPMEMEIGPDGSLYVLEYGENWFAANKDARLSKISYSKDNHAPVAKMEVDKEIGGAPLKVHFSANQSFDDDPDDSLSYEWRIDSPSKINSRKKEFDFVFAESGIYQARLVVTDKKGRSAATSSQIKVGNYPPEVNIELAGNQSFFWPDSPIEYEVKVQDREDGTSQNGKISTGFIRFFAEKLQGTEDQTTQAQGHQSQSIEMEGRTLINGSDCKNCHQEKVRSAGPAYLEVANKYRSIAGAEQKLAKKIINGGGGNWGDHAMSAHPQISLTDARKMVAYILSLKGNGKAPALLGKGKFNPGKMDETEHLVLTALYKDQGAKGIEGIETKTQIVLKYPKLEAQNAEKAWEAFPKNIYGKAPFFMRFFKDGAYISYSNIDLKGIRKIKTKAFAEGQIPLELEIRIDSLGGKTIGQTALKSGKSYQDFSVHEIHVSPVSGKRNLFFVLKGQNLPQKGSNMALEWVYFEK